MKTVMKVIGAPILAVGTILMFLSEIISLVFGMCYGEGFWQVFGLIVLADTILRIAGLIFYAVGGALFGARKRRAPTTPV